MTQVASVLIPVRTLGGCFKVNNPRTVATVPTISVWEVLVYYLLSVFFLPFLYASHWSRYVHWRLFVVLSILLLK